MVNGDVDTGRVTVGIGDAGIVCEVDLGSVDDLSCDGLQFPDLVSCPCLLSLLLRGMFNGTSADTCNKLLGGNPT